MKNLYFKSKNKHLFLNLKTFLFIFLFTSFQQNINAQTITYYSSKNYTKLNNSKIIFNRTTGDYDLSFDNFEIKASESHIVCEGNDPGEDIGATSCISFVYDGQHVEYTTVRAADGNIWLQQNLGSETIATTMNDENSYGDLFQWGRWTDGHQKRSSETTTATPTPNNPTGISSELNSYITSSPSWWSTNQLTDEWNVADISSVTETNGCDPCRALGEGWKLPTQDDWTTLVDAEGFNNPADAFASTLKLPANGYRSSSNGTFTFVGQRGYYWSSTTSSTGAKYLYIGTTLANPAAGAPRGQGAAIRCVKLSESLNSINFNKNNTKIYPNPTTDFITVQSDLNINIIEVYNQLGQLITTQESNIVDLSNVSSGIYILKIQLDDSTIITQKIVKK